MIEFVKASFYFPTQAITRKQAEAHLKFLVRNSPEPVQYYGFSEPVKKKWTDSKSGVLAARLAGYPIYRNGLIYLKSDHQLFELVNKIRDLYRINVYVDPEKWKDPTWQARFHTFLKAISEELSPFYGMAASNEQIMEQNYLEVRSAAGTSLYKKGLDFSNGIPGAYWFNFLSAEFLNSLLTKHDILSLKDIEPVNSGIIFLTALDPVTPAPESRSNAEKFIAKIGANNFFDKLKPQEDLPALKFIENLFRWPSVKAGNILPPLPLFLMGQYQDKKEEFLSAFKRNKTGGKNEVPALPKEKLIEASLIIGNYILNYFEGVWLDEEGYVQTGINESYFLDPLAIAILHTEDDLQIQDFVEYIENIV